MGTWSSFIDFIKTTEWWRIHRRLPTASSWKLPSLIKTMEYFIAKDWDQTQHVNENIGNDLNLKFEALIWEGNFKNTVNYVPWITIMGRIYGDLLSVLSDCK